MTWHLLGRMQQVGGHDNKRQQQNNKSRALFLKINLRWDEMNSSERSGGGGHTSDIIRE